MKQRASTAVAIMTGLMAAGTFLTSCVPAGSSGAGPDLEPNNQKYPWHTDIIATTFWVGEVFDPNAPDGSQLQSAYDSFWLENYGGCDGVVVDNVCTTERRTQTNGYFPTQMVPKQNPFYLDLPFDDINDPLAFAMRGSVIPWAQEPGYAGKETDKSFSYMKNRWVRIKKGDRTCYGQVEDAGPGKYDDASYVFGKGDQRPANTEFNGAGMDVSPALNGCLGFSSLNGAQDKVDWQFVDEEDVPNGPWLKRTTTLQVQQGQRSS